MCDIMFGLLTFDFEFILIFCLYIVSVGLSSYLDVGRLGVLNIGLIG